jgi:hypothetical protein
VIEDTDMTADDLRQLGFEEDVVLAVVALSRETDETFYDYIQRVSAFAVAKVVKLVDLEDNAMDGIKEGSLKDKYRFAYQYLSGLNPSF